MSIYILSIFNSFDYTFEDYIGGQTTTPHEKIEKPQHIKAMHNDPGRGGTGRARSISEPVLQLHTAPKGSPVSKLPIHTFEEDFETYINRNYTPTETSNQDHIPQCIHDVTKCCAGDSEKHFTADQSAKTVPTSLLVHTLDTQDTVSEPDYIHYQPRKRLVTGTGPTKYETLHFPSRQLQAPLAHGASSLNSVHIGT